jgi:hypothetical protein
MATGAAKSDAERQWHILGRWEEYEGEGRANLLRIIGVAVFYAIELVNYYGLRIGVLEMPAIVDRTFHLAVTMLVLVWAMVCLGVFLCRTQGYFPSSLKYISTGCDLVLLTIILGLADGPRSPLVIGYFLIVVLAGLRFQLPLLWFATAGAMAGYLGLLGYARWFAEREDLRVPRYHQLIMLIGLALTGVVVGQILQRMRRLAEAYAQRRQDAAGGSP